jgi:hypothetical protein
MHRQRFETLRISFLFGSRFNVIREPSSHKALCALCHIPAILFFKSMDLYLLYEFQIVSGQRVEIN